MFARSLLRSNAALSYSCNALTQLFKSGTVTCRTAAIVRPISCSACRFQEDVESEEKPTSRYTTDPSREGCKNYKVRMVDIQDSIRYMDSEAYRDVYKDEPVWKPYRRNQKGSIYQKPKKTCIRRGAIATSSPCPMCRDDYLVFDYRNLKLMSQFISETDGRPLKQTLTNLCLAQTKKLKLELAKAQDFGLLEKHIPLRSYNYDFYKNLVQKEYGDQMKEQDTNQNQSTSS